MIKNFGNNFFSFLFVIPLDFITDLLNSFFARASMNLYDYLERLGFKGKPKMDLSTLKKLHVSHLYKIPFENLDIHNNKQIILNIERFLKKVIINRRGGFCYELNGSFKWLLEQIGFNSYFISCSVFLKEKSRFSEYFSHIAIIVLINGEKWLVDVGFGHSFIAPLKIQFEETVSEKGINYNFVKESDEIVLYRREKGSPNEAMYKFRDIAYNLSDFLQMCIYHQKSPDSSFTQSKVCSILTDNGRLTLTDDKVISTFIESGKKEISEVKGEHDFYKKLSKLFNINLKP